MGKKTKQGKGRLDKFYYMAKEQGYRSRAAFKLIQLNKKYDFLSQSKCIVDLCAAPGGWLQVCAKYMPIASIKIGVDLDPIPAIKGCVTFQADITTQRCMSLIKKELKHFKADCVLNDGAPNVGANWTVDAYNQVELSLYAMKVATETLRKGGWFITKVFRSKDYNALMYIANQLFNKVESNKPQSSRQTSAEIFMVCSGYKAPDIIDPKLLDPKFALETVEEDNENENLQKTTSLKKLLTVKKKHRDGYKDGIHQLYSECELMEFINAQDPHEYLSGFNKFIITDEFREALKEVRMPKDLELICGDLKLCGRKEFSDLLKMRHSYNVLIDKKIKEIDEHKKSLIPVVEKTQEELEADVDRELDRVLEKVEAKKKRQLKKQKELDAKQDYRKKMSVIAATAIDNDDDLRLDKRTWDKLKELDVDENPDVIPDDSSSEEEETIADKRFKFHNDGLVDKLQRQAGEDSDSISEDEKITKIDKMAMEFEENIQQEKEYKMLITKKESNKANKAKANIELQRTKKMDLSDDEMLENHDVAPKKVDAEAAATGADSSENDDDLDEEREIKRIMKEQIDLKRQKVKDDEDEEEKQLFLNPLLAMKAKKEKKNAKGEGEGEVSDKSEWSDDDKYDPKLTNEQIKENKDKERKLLGKRSKSGLQGDMDDLKDFFNPALVEVPVEDLAKKQKEEDEDLPSGYTSMDSTEIAETRALAKKMLRKKFRQETIEASYGRFAFEDDKAVIPNWFEADEERNNRPNINLTQEEVDVEKQQLKEWNARPSKKVTEAKNRKKMRLVKAMGKIKTKANIITNQSDATEGSKMRQIQKLYKKEKEKHKEEKSYVVNRTHTTAMGKKAGRNVKMVDARLRADTRNQKIKSKKKGGKGHNGKGSKTKKGRA